MKAGLALVVVLLLAALPVAAGQPQDAVPGELLAGTLGSLAGLTAGYFGGRALGAALGLESQLDSRDPVTVACVVLGVTSGASLGVAAAGSALGVEGNALACAGGAFLGLVAGMAVEPLLGLLLPRGPQTSPDLLEILGTVVEAVGFVAATVLPAVGATVGFNLGARPLAQPD